MMRAEEFVVAVATQRRRAQVVLPQELIDQLDALVGPCRRRQFVQEAIEEKLRRVRRIRAYDELAGSLEDIDIPGWETSESTALWVRDLGSNPDKLAEPLGDGTGWSCSPGISSTPRR